MANSKIVITFADDVSAGTIITFKTESVINPAFFTSKTEIFVLNNPRTSNFTVPIEAPSIPAGSSSAYAYSFYWNLDYNGSNLFTVSVLSNVVTIEITNEVANLKIKFTEFSSTSPDVTAVITNDGTSTSPFTIDSVVNDVATIPCNDVELNFTTSEIIPEIWLDGVQIESSNVNNPYVVEVSRAVQHQFRFVSSSGYQAWYPSKLSFLRFEKLAVGNLSYDVKPSIAGATLTVNYRYNILDNPVPVLEYSLNNINWQSSPIFTGQVNGSGTLYVRDQYGCTISTGYTITDAGTRTPYLYISKASSIGFVENVNWNGYTSFKNESNVLNMQDLPEFSYCEETLFQTNDLTTIQFKSNYDTPTVKLRHENGTETNITLDKKSENLNRYRQMDCMYYKYEDGYLGLYFDSGNTYDELDIVNGNYTLNGNLPEFAIVGQYINIKTIGVFQIFDVVFDDVLGKKVIVVEYSYSGIATPAIVESNYDLLQFEVYEFTIDWSLYGEGLYDVIIYNTDTYNGTVQHISENILIQDVHEKTLAIRYYNDNNRDVFYKYGIQHFIRMPYNHIEALPLDDSDINISDLVSSVVESNLHEVVKFYFADMTTPMMRKLSVAVSCDNLFINNEGFIKNEKISTENIFNTNLHAFSVELLKSNINYNNNRQGQSGIDVGIETFDIPAFVFGDGGFVKS